MKKFRVTKECDYVQGYLRYGHLEGVFEAESKEEVEKMFADNFFGDLDLIVDDYRVDGYELSDEPMVIEEVKNNE